MKYYKIKLLKNPVNNQYVYPLNYQAEIGNFAVDHLYFTDAETEEDYLLLLIKDKNATNIIRDNVTEISEAEAKLISQQHEVKLEKITDEAKIRRLELKATLNIPLTADELKAIDPNDATSGFGIEKILADRIDTLKTARVVVGELLETK